MNSKDSWSEFGPPTMPAIARSRWTNRSSTQNEMSWFWQHETWQLWKKNMYRNLWNANSEAHEPLKAKWICHNVKNLRTFEAIIMNATLSQNVIVITYNVMECYLQTKLNEYSYSYLFTALDWNCTRKHSLHKRECAQKVGDTIKSNGKRKQGFKSTIFQLPTVVASFWVGVTPCSHLRGHRPRP